jgi:protein O-mannosyl-transferase
LAEALRAKPEDAEAHNNLAVALFQLGRVPEAIGHLEEVLRLKSADTRARNNLAITLSQQGAGLAAQGKWSEAMRIYERAIELKRDYAPAHEGLGLVLSRLGRYGEAVTRFEQALAIDPRWVSAQNNLAWLLATSVDVAVRNGARAITLAEEANSSAAGKDPGVLNTLAAAYAEAGRFNEAVQTAQAALALVLRDSGQATGSQRDKPSLTTHLPSLAEIQQRLELYRAGQPNHEGSPASR